MERELIAMSTANRDFRLTKTSGWDSVALERVSESTKEGRGAELGAVICGEGASSAPLHRRALLRGDQLNMGGELMARR